jgi:hypothetical protein
MKTCDEYGTEYETEENISQQTNDTINKDIKCPLCGSETTLDDEDYDLRFCTNIDCPIFTFDPSIDFTDAR